MMGVRSQVNQEQRVSIGPRNMYSRGHWIKLIAKVISGKHIEDELLPDTAFAGQTNGLCGPAQQGRLFFVTAIQNGAISLECELHAQEPVIKNEYQEIVEVSLVVGDEPISLCEWAHEETHKLKLNAGSYRVRYLVQGFDKDYDEERDEDDSYWKSPLEGQFHLIQNCHGDVE